MLVPMIRRVLERSRLVPRQMDAFGFVQGLAFASGRPVVPVPTLLALAEQSNESRVIAALDARMGEAYVAAYARNADDWDEVIAPRLCGPEGLPPLPGRRWAATGSGFD